MQSCMHLANWTRSRYPVFNNIANRSRVSCINTNRSYNLATSGESRRYVVAFNPFCGWEHLATSRESKTHLASHGYAPGTIAVNVTWMKRGFNACQKHRSMYLSIFNRFPVIQPLSSKVRHFSTFLHILTSLGTPLGQSR